ncbi:MAG: hypothetical protein NXI14_03795 [bacterium]|nr:hypothetical protein [bacterium]
MATPNDLLRFASDRAGFDFIPADSCLLHDTGQPIQRCMASVNATTGDLMLARQLGCDSYLLHHPLAGSARRDFHRVLDRMVELMEMHGVSGDVARTATSDLRRRCRFADHAADWDQLVSAAQLIGINLFNIHLAADELGRQEMVRAVKGLSPDATLEDAAEALRAIPELGHPSNEILHVPEGPSGRCGRLAIMHAGGTNGGASVAEALFDHTSNHAEGPVETVLYIHLSGADAKQLEERAASGKPGSVIVAGHFASDAIGLNMLLRDATDKFGIDFVRHGGLAAFDAR